MQKMVYSQLGPIVIWAQFQKTTGPPGPSRGWAQMIFRFNMEAQLGPRGPVEVGPTRRHVLLVTPRMDPPRLGQTMTGPVRAPTGPNRFHHDWARAQSRLGSSGLQPSGPGGHLGPIPRDPGPDGGPSRRLKSVPDVYRAQLRYYHILLGLTSEGCLCVPKALAACN